MPDEEMPPRFGALVSDDDVRASRARATLKNTLARNEWIIHTFNIWTTARNAVHVDPEEFERNKWVKVEPNLESMKGDQLCYWLGKFVVEVPKHPSQSYRTTALICQAHRRCQQNTSGRLGFGTKTQEGDLPLWNCKPTEVPCEIVGEIPDTFSRRPQRKCILPNPTQKPQTGHVVWPHVS